MFCVSDGHDVEHFMGRHSSFRWLASVSQRQTLFLSPISSSHARDRCSSAVSRAPIEPEQILDSSCSSQATYSTVRSTLLLCKARGTE